MYQLKTGSSTQMTRALPIENAKINEALRKAYEELKSINKAKDRLIHHLFHELKTPFAVLTSTIFKLFSKKLEKLGIDDETVSRILKRGERNLR